MKIATRRKYRGAAVKWTKAELFWRDAPEYEYDLHVDGHNELLLL
jgi:hypothetical protein